MQKTLKTRKFGSVRFEFEGKNMTRSSSKIENSSSFQFEKKKLGTIPNNYKKSTVRKFRTEKVLVRNGKAKTVSYFGQQRLIG